MCNSPLHAFDTGYFTEKGGKAYRICSGDTYVINKPVNDLPWGKITTRRLYSNKPSNQYSDVLLRDYVDIPCGKCMQCRLDYTRAWAIRCYLESLDWTENYMVTLTYDNEHVPKGPTGNLTLNPKDVELFMKRLREHQERKHNRQIRFFLAGEYGGDDEYTDNKGVKRKGTERPHYHFIAYNLNCNDLIPFFRNEFNQQVYLCPEIAKIWGKGQVTVCECNWNTCAYVARYILKKQKGSEAEEYYNQKGIVPEFTRMSRSPGIAKAYYDAHKEEIWKGDEIVIRKQKIDERYQLTEEVVRVKPPKYFMQLYELEEPDMAESLKQFRKEQAKASKEMALMRTTMSEQEYLAEAERRLLKKIKNIRHEMFKEAEG